MIRKVNLESSQPAENNKNTTLLNSGNPAKNNLNTTQTKRTEQPANYKIEMQKIDEDLTLQDNSDGEFVETQGG